MPKGRGSKKTDLGRDGRRKRALRDRIVSMSRELDQPFPEQVIRREANLRVGLHAND